MTQETEIPIYARVGNPAGLDQALKYYDQEQAQLRGDNGRMRVRMEREQGNQDWTYTATKKSGFNKTGGVQDCVEDNDTITAKVYEMFKSMCADFQRKRRYIFAIEKVTITATGFEGSLEVPDLVYEVDRFIKEDGTFSNWVKIDVELNKLLQALEKASIDPNKPMELKFMLSKLPFEPQAAFVEDPSNPKSQELIKAIFDKEFIRPITPPTQVATEHHQEASSAHQRVTKAFVAALKA